MHRWRQIPLHHLPPQAHIEAIGIRVHEWFEYHPFVLLEDLRYFALGLLVYDPKCCNIHYQRPWGFRFVRNMFWLMAGQGSLSFDRRAPSSKLYLIPPIFAIGLAASPIFLLLPVFNIVYATLVFSYLGVVVAETLRLIYQLKSDASKSIGLFFIFPFAIFVHHVVSGFGFIFGFCRRFLNKLSLTQEKKG